MFNLLVSANETAWESKRMTMSVSRFKEFSGDEAQTISEREPSSLKALESVPALLMYETIVEGPEAEVVRIGQLRDIRNEGSSLTFRFSEDGRLNRERVLKDAGRFQINKWEASRTHWAIKDGSPPHEI